MAYTLTVDCTTNIRTKKEKRINLEIFKLPKPGKSGCSTLPQTDIQLPSGAVFEVICEATKYGNRLSIWEKESTAGSRRLFGVSSNGEFSAVHRIEPHTEITLILSE